MSKRLCIKGVCVSMLFLICLNLNAAGNNDDTISPPSSGQTPIQKGQPLENSENEDNNTEQDDINIEQEMPDENSALTSEESSPPIDVPEVSYVDSQHKFRLLEYDGEVLDVTFNKDGGIKTKVLAQGTSVVIKTFDSLMRVPEIAVFSLKSGRNVLTKKTVFLYEENSQFPAESTEIDYIKNEKIVCLYNKTGFILSKKHYSGSYAFASSQAGQDVLLVQEKFSYDDKNKIIEHVKKTDAVEVTKIYNYDKDFPNPDTKIFSNGVLREEIQYSEELSYTKTTYFDDNQSVIAVYADGIKKEELFKSGSKILRRILY